MIQHSLIVWFKLASFLICHFIRGREIKQQGGKKEKGKKEQKGNPFQRKEQNLCFGFINLDTQLSYTQ